MLLLKLDSSFWYAFLIQRLFEGINVGPQLPSIFFWAFFSFLLHIFGLFSDFSLSIWNANAEAQKVAKQEASLFDLCTITIGA